MIKKSRSLVKELGVGNAIMYICHAALQKIHPKMGLYSYYFYSQSLVESFNATMNTGKNEFSWLVENHHILQDLPRPPEIIEQRFSEGSRCFVASVGGMFRGCIWIAPKRYLEDEVRCDFNFAESDVWDFDVYVVPKYRIGRLFVQMWNTASCELMQQGVQNSISRISAYNRNSISSHEKLGAKRLGKASFLCFGTVQLYIGGRAPFLHLGFSENSRPCIQVT